MASLIATLLLSISPASASCSIDLVSPADGATASASPAFSWSGDCVEYRLVLSPSGSFADDRRRRSTTKTSLQAPEALWNAFQAEDGAGGTWWAVVGLAADGTRVHSEMRYLAMDPDLDDDGYSVGDGDCDDSAGGVGVCDEHASCAPDGGGGNVCVCDDGYLGDGETCLSDEPCADNGDCGDGLCVDLGMGAHTCACDHLVAWEDDVCVPETPAVTFVNAARRVRADLGTAVIDLTRSVYASSDAQVPYTLSGELMGNAASGTVSFGAGQAWAKLTLAIDPAASVGDELVVTLGTPTSSGEAPELGAISAHAIVVADPADPCLSAHPKLGSHSVDDVDADGIPDGCDLSLAPPGFDSEYLQPVAADASTDFITFGLMAQNAITDVSFTDPPAESFIFDHDWHETYAADGAWLPTDAAVPQWFAVSFHEPVTVDEIRLVNFANVNRDQEWMRGVREIAVYGSNASGEAPVVYAPPRADMHYLGTIEFSSAQDRSWIGSGVEGLPEVVRVPSPGEYQHLLLEVRSSYRPDNSWAFPGDLSGFRKIEFATYR